ncbi:MAG: lytic transglycosylase domain-containing protein [Alphaproteobacteria bacterium]|jgi:soluble lytic murein transglycosylase-like protein
MTDLQKMSRRGFVVALLGLTGVVAGCAASYANAKAVAIAPRARINAKAVAIEPRARVKAMVVREAIDLGVPAPLALAVAHAESNFNPAAESRVGARGVMQIMPATARGEYAIHADQLWDLRINIRLGLHFLRRLIDRYGGRVDWALSYYNGGSAVGPPSRARVIPATRAYVRKVERLRNRYRRALARGEV